MIYAALKIDANFSDDDGAVVDSFTSLLEIVSVTYTLAQRELERHQYFFGKIEILCGDEVQFLLV